MGWVTYIKRLPRLWLVRFNPYFLEPSNTRQPSAFVRKVQVMGGGYLPKPQQSPWSLLHFSSFFVARTKLASKCWMWQTHAKFDSLGRCNPLFSIRRGTKYTKNLARTPVQWNLPFRNHVCATIASWVQYMIEGSLEAKLPTIWTVETQSREEAERRERLEERRGRCAKR